MSTFLTSYSLDLFPYYLNKPLDHTGFWKILLPTKDPGKKFQHNFML